MATFNMPKVGDTFKTHEDFFQTCFGFGDPLPQRAAVSKEKMQEILNNSSWQGGKFNDSLWQSGVWFPKPNTLVYENEELGSQLNVFDPQNGIFTTEVQNPPQKPKSFHIFDDDFVEILIYDNKNKEYICIGIFEKIEEVSVGNGKKYTWKKI